MRSILVLFCLGILLSGCLGSTDPGPGLPTLLRQFPEAMRWKDFHGAASYLQPAAQEIFSEQFNEDDDLFIVGSRIIKVDLHEKEGWAEAEYEMEYYRLPSTRVKKWQWTQRWSQSENIMKPGVWLIENAPPVLPWKD